LEILRKIALKIDTFLESFALIALLSVILIMTMQVFTRKLFNFVFFWSEESILLLLVWFAFMGMAIGFREYIHLGVDSFTDYLPKKVNLVLDKVIELVNFGCGLYFIIYGWEFTVLMANSTLAATKLPNSCLYAVMPLCGVMMCCYSALHLIGVDTRRHKGTEIEMDMGLEDKPDGK
jgi:TRAP-type C4-dicarboxylate transport system permease small subunit